MQNKISALYLCAEILIHPTQDTILKAMEFKDTDGNNLLSTNGLSQIEIEAEYIQLFSVGSTSNKCVPLASWWIDGRMMGKSFGEIKEFYRQCGFSVDTEVIRVPDDHLGVMLLFVALLCEEKRFTEVKFFIENYLAWIEKLEISIEKVSPDSLFLQVISTSKNILTILKEKL